MQREEIAARFWQAFETKNVSAIMKLMHPKAIYHDAFWGECSTGNDLAEYVEDALENDEHCYAQVGDAVITISGFVIRYLAFHKDDEYKKTPLYNGAEVITLADGLIRTISDHYCDPSVPYLVELSALVDVDHINSNVVPLGLSAKTSGRIKRRLAELTEKTDVFLDPTLTVTRVADLVECTVMQLFHVLEVEKETTFVAFVNECRARYATTLLLDGTGSNIQFEQIADKAGFESIREFCDAFEDTFGDGPEAYMKRFGR